MDILHSDCNNFYASVEMLSHPELKDKPMVVCGSIKDRHGIILSKNYPAKALGMFTGQTLMEAFQICPTLVAIEADFEKYLKVSKKVKDIYREYSDQVESFGIDEAWIDVTHSKIFGSPIEIAEKIRTRIKKEIGITVSIGVSFNKVFAKLASDLKKPDAVSEISQQNFKNVAWSLPVKDLLFVGRATTKKFSKLNIETIGDLANYNLSILEKKFGKWGNTLWKYANGLDNSVVRKVGCYAEIKSVGNSLTCYRDLENMEDVKALLTVLSESVANRMFDYGIYKARTLSLTARNTDLVSVTRQIKFIAPTALSGDILSTAIELFEKSNIQLPLRSMGISVCDFVFESEQLSLFQNTEKYNKLYALDRTIKKIRDKNNFSMLTRGSVAIDSRLSLVNPQADHTIHPVGVI